MSEFKDSDQMEDIADGNYWKFLVKKDTVVT